MALVLKKSAASRRFVGAVGGAAEGNGMGWEFSDLGLLVIQWASCHMDEDMTLVAAIGRRCEQRRTSARAGRGRHGTHGDRAGVDRMISSSAASIPPCRAHFHHRRRRRLFPRRSGRRLDATRPFSVVSVHEARNIMDRLPKSMHAQVRRVLRQAWEIDDADKAEKHFRNLARRLEREFKGGCCRLDPGRGSTRCSP